MNKVAEDKVQNNMYTNNSIDTLKKTKKEKNLRYSTGNMNIKNDGNFNDNLALNVHVNNINCNVITNGLNDHSNEDAKDDHDRQSHALNNSNNHCIDSGNDKAVNNLEHQNNPSNQHEVRDLVEEALCNLEHSLCLEEHLDEDITIVSYENELVMPEIMRLIQKDLSEPYSIYTYRYFIHNWPRLCFLAMHKGNCIGAIVCKLDMHRNAVKRGYIAMLAVDKEYRKRRIGSRLVQKAIQAMMLDNADEVVLETEIINKPALKLYENLGFVRDKRLFRYYLNGVDALRLKLWLR